MKKLLFLDTETTGIDGGRCIELAYSYREGVLITSFYKRFRNPVPISVEAMAVHHITEEMVSGLNLLSEDPYYSEMKSEIEGSIVVAHNAKFDMGVLAYEDIHAREFIDTKRVAKHLLPEAPRHNLQYLRYYLKLRIEGDAPAHTAAGDVEVLMALYDYLYKICPEKNSDQDTTYMMQVLSRTPALVETLQFGKHYGKTFEEVARTDPGYLKYLRDNPRDDEDVIHTVDYWLNKKS